MLAIAQVRQTSNGERPTIVNNTNWCLSVGGRNLNQDHHIRTQASVLINPRVVYPTTPRPSNKTATNVHAKAATGTLLATVDSRAGIFFSRPPPKLAKSVIKVS